MTIVPVDDEHVGWVSVVNGDDGVAGWAVIVTLVPDEIHPTEFLAVRV